MSTKTVATLRAEAKKKGIVGYSKMRKAELIAALGPPKVVWTKTELVDIILRSLPSHSRAELMKLRVADLRAMVSSQRKGPLAEAKSMKLTVGREKRYASGEKFVWKVSSVDDVSAKLEVLVDRKWLVPAILNPEYGMAKKLWTERASLSGGELADWGFDEITVAFGKSAGADGYSPPEEEEGYTGPRFGGKLKK